MGNASNDEASIFIGEFNLQEESAALPCNFSEAATVQLVLQDSAGRSMMTKNWAVDGTTSQLTFDVSELDSGHFNAWIYVGDRVVIRSLHVQGSDKPTGLSRFFGFFK